MEPMWWFLTISGVGVPLILLILDRRNESEVRRDWERLLTPRGVKLYRSIESRMQREKARGGW